MENAEDQTEVEATDAENPDRIALHGLEVIQQALLKLLQLARREVLMIMPTMQLLLNDQNINKACSILCAILVYGKCKYY